MGGILRPETLNGGFEVSDKAADVSVNCPRCGAIIACSDLSDDVAIRCHECNYQMIRRSDLLLIINECKGAQAQQASSAGKVLIWLSGYIPEASTVLGMLPSQQKAVLSLSEGGVWNRLWDRLVSAYAAGDINAKHGLNQICRSNPELYECHRCKSCGAAVYSRKNSSEIIECSYCQSVN